MQVTVVYDCNRKTEREELWRELKDIYDRTMGMNESWLVMGDYNETRVKLEREGQGTYDEDGAVDFNSMIKATCLNELPSIGGCFTWSNKSVSDLVRSRFDHMLASEEWLVRWPLASVEIFHRETNDYVALITRLQL